MVQLVNSDCTICHQRIASVLDASFCSACGYPVHDQCRRPGSQENPSVCPACGTDTEAAEKQAEEQESMLEAERMKLPLPPLEFEKTLHSYRLARLWLGAAAGSCVGVAVLASGEVAAGLGALFASLGIAMIAFFAGKRRR